MFSLEEWKTIKLYHETQLALANDKIRDIYASLPWTQEELKKKVLQIETRTLHKKRWSQAIDDGLLENIQSILNKDTYNAYVDVDFVDYSEENKKEHQKKVLSFLGVYGSIKWQQFVLQVITFLHQQDSFSSPDEDELDTFEDTAGGCDEIVWNAGVDIIQKESKFYS
jgi:hypothetical protein